MANHTITVFRLEQNNFDFGLNDYPIFDEEYRPILNENILGFYRFHEIGFTNPIEFRERLRQRMNLIMRYKYNKLYEIRQKEFNPLYNIEIHETTSREVAETSSDKGSTSASETYNGGSSVTSEASVKSSNTSANTDTKTTTATSSSGVFPTQKMLEGDLSSGLYADSANNSKATDNATTNGTQETEQTDNRKESASINDEQSKNSSMTAEGEKTIVETLNHDTLGSSAGLPFSKAMLQFKEFISEYHLDEQVIAELGDLFMSVY